MAPYSHWLEVSEKEVGCVELLSMAVAVHLSLEPALLLEQLAAVPLKPAKVHTASISLSIWLATRIFPALSWQGSDPPGKGAVRSTYLSIELCTSICFMSS